MARLAACGLQARRSPALALPAPVSAARAGSRAVLPQPVPLEILAAAALDAARAKVKTGPVSLPIAVPAVGRLPRNERDAALPRPRAPGVALLARVGPTADVVQ